MTGPGDIRLCDLASVSEATPTRVTLDGRAAVAVFKVGDEVYVTDDLCTHGQASLSEDGELEGYTIICSWHEGAFDIRTGDATARPCIESLRVYPVSIREGGIYITL